MVPQHGLAVHQSQMEHPIAASTPTQIGSWVELKTLAVACLELWPTQVLMLLHIKVRMDTPVQMAAILAKQPA